jgi:FAD dependent oxidoreductase TIGR03364
MTSTIIIVGGGVLGTMHAVEALRRGYSVVQMDAEPEPQGATVRNFGFLQVSVRAPGAELEAAARSRIMWERLAENIPGLGFRPDGSLTLLTQPEEITFAERLLEREDTDVRRLSLIDPATARRVNPAVRGDFLGALHSTADAVVEPRRVLPALRSWMTEQGRRYRFLPSTVAMEAADGTVIDHLGRVHTGDLVVVCPGAIPHGFTPTLLASTDQYPVYLQMLQTDPYPERLTTAVAGGDVMRDYPGFDIPERASLPPLPEVSIRYDSHLLVTQRADGELTIGDTHHTSLPLPFDVDETPFEHLTDQVSSLLGRPLPPIRRRWAGIYGRLPDGALCVRRSLDPRTTLVTGIGGRGMTISPAVAQDTLDIITGGSQ